MKCEFLLVLLLWGMIHYSEAHPLNKDYDYLKLVSRWPKSYCLTHDGACQVESIPQNFVINRLQAFKLPGIPLQNCSTQYDLSDELGTYREDLLKFWPDLSTDSFLLSKEMWKEQWRMYGSCSDATMNPQEYILCALYHRKAHDLKRLLRKSGIIPSEFPYPSRRILKDLKRSLGVQVDIVCETNTNGVVFLSEIHLCIDYNGKILIDCFNRAKGCEEDPIYPYGQYQLEGDSH